jgi:hypothetical protein
MDHVFRAGGLAGRVAGIVSAVAVLVVLALVAETTTDRSGPVLLKSITALSRYEAASGSFQVVVNLSQHTAFLPSFVEGSQTLFLGQGTDIAYVDFAGLKGKAIQVSPDRTAVTVRLPMPQLAPAVLDVHQSYVYAQQQGLLNRIGNFFAGNPNSQQQVYELAQQKIGQAAHSSPLVSEAMTNTRGMMSGMLHSLGFTQVTIRFGG